MMCYRRHCAQSDKGSEGMRRSHALWYVLFGTIFMTAVSVITATLWYGETYTVRFKELLYTLLGPLEGTGNSIRNLIVLSLMPPILVLMLFYVAAAFLLSEHPLNERLWTRINGGRAFPRRVLGVLRRLGALGCVGLLIFSAFYVDSQMAIAEFIASQSEETLLYEAEYVDPAGVAILPPERPRNLICIVVESLETSYMAKAQGGFQEQNLLPGLTRLMEENLHFACAQTASGWNYLLGTSWTMASLLATTSGIPFAFPVDGNAMEEESEFAPRLTALGDLLAAQGYQQEFLCGSDAAFGGRKLYFEQHGGYAICDLFAVREQGRIPQDYYEWWGFEDRILFDIARDEATRLSQGDAPFNLTLLTADLHHLDGYVCPECGDAYEEQTANVAACTDRLVTAFVDWCRAQPFYEDTTILVMGDHPRMDTSLVEDVPMEARTVYHCLLNPAATPSGDVGNRIFTAMDMYPTTLAALGYRIEGERLGLGVNLFSAEPTLAERMGMETLSSELDKHSAFYLEHFYEQ